MWHGPPAAALLAPAPPGGMPRQWARLFLDSPWPMLQAFLNAAPGKLLSTPERARKFLFSPDLPEETVLRHAARLGRESFRAGLETSHGRPDPARIRGTPLLALEAERDYIRQAADALLARLVRTLESGATAS